MSRSLVAALLLAVVHSGCSGKTSGGPGLDSGGAGGDGSGGDGGGGGSGGGGSGGGGGGSGGGGAGGSGGATGGTGGGVIGPGSYALPPPNPCSNQFSNQDCRAGEPATACGGVCSHSYGPTAQSVCAGGYTGIPSNYACPRFMLYSDEMNQAVRDDGYGGQLNYGVIGHDVDNGTGGVDEGLSDSCCQCYQIVFDYAAEDQTWVDPHTLGVPQSAILVPPPMVVQSFNTATNNSGDFDIYMGGGGFGSNNGCYVPGGACPGGPCMYTSYPTQNGGMVKAVGDTFSNPPPNPCKISPEQWVTQETLTSAACANAVTTMCNQIVSPNPSITTQTVRSCIQSNGVVPDETGEIPGNYHVNWYIWVKRVECPAHLTEVTGCKLAAQNLPPVDPTIDTVAEARAAGFLQTSADGNRFHTTQMQDCCMATCSWTNNISGTTVDGYDSFYSCDQNGVPWTTAVTRGAP